MRFLNVFKNEYATFLNVFKIWMAVGCERGMPGLGWDVRGGCPDWGGM
jgi:hypothetical protein